MARYDLSTRLLHHAVFALIAVAFGLALCFDDLHGPEKLNAVLLHKSLGLSVLLLGAWRITRRLRIKTPAYVPDLATWEKKTASATHVLLYAGLMAVPFFGWALSSAAGYPASWFGVFDFPVLFAKDPELRNVFKELHETGGYVLVSLVALHGAAALYHRFIKRDNVLQRMWP